MSAEPTGLLHSIPDPKPTGMAMGGKRLFWLLAILSLLVEGGALALALSGQTAAALGLHLLWSAILVVLAWRSLRHNNGVRLICLLALSVGVMGPLGAVGATIAVLTLLWAQRHATPFADWYAAIFPVEERSIPQKLYDAIRGGKEDDALATAVGSFTDIMRNGSSRQKQIVIALISRNYRPSFAPALLEGLNDADASVRVQAASATAFVEHSLSERLVELSRAAGDRAGDPEARLALARHQDLYAISGLADAERSATLRRQAADGYRLALAARPDDAVLRLEFGRLLVRLDEVAEAIDVLAGLDPDRLLNEAAPWYAECLYRTDRMQELRSFSERAIAWAEAAGLPLRPRIRFWARNRPDAETVAAG